MTLTYNTELPGYVRNVLPYRMQTQFRQAFNTELGKGASEKVAVRKAWVILKDSIEGAPSMSASNIEGNIHVPSFLRGKKKKKKVEKAEPRTLYVSRSVTNAKEILSWAKGQGFKTLLKPDDLHVTIAHSKVPVDWMKFQNDYGPGDMTVSPGGPRLVEPLGDKGAVVLLFNDSTLAYRNRMLQDGGVVWDYESYQPHITLTYDAEGLDLSMVEPYQGKIELGPEKFTEIDDNWADNLTEKRAAYANMVQKVITSDNSEGNRYHEDHSGRFTSDSGSGAGGSKKASWNPKALAHTLEAVVGDVAVQHALLKGVRYLAPVALAAAPTSISIAVALATAAMMHFVLDENGVTIPGVQAGLDSVVESVFEKTDGVGDNKKLFAILKQVKLTEESAKKSVAYLKEHAPEIYAKLQKDGIISDKVSKTIINVYMDDDVDVKVVKVDKSLGLVFGWAIVCKRNGKDYFDLNIDHGGEKVPEHITENAMLTASTDFMQNYRVAKEMHIGDAQGSVVFAFPMTTEIAKALNISTPITGLLIAMKPEAAMLAKFASGELKGFSIGGSRIKSREYEATT